MDLTIQHMAKVTTSTVAVPSLSIAIKDFMSVDTTVKNKWLSTVDALHNEVPDHDKDKMKVALKEAFKAYAKTINAEPEAFLVFKAPDMSKILALATPKDVAVFEAARNGEHECGGRMFPYNLNVLLQVARTGKSPEAIKAETDAKDLAPDSPEALAKAKADKASEEQQAKLDAMTPFDRQDTTLSLWIAQCNLLGLTKSQITALLEAHKPA